MDDWRIVMSSSNYNCGGWERVRGDNLLRRRMWRRTLRKMGPDEKQLPAELGWNEM